jgi:hypothetical protein
MARRFPQRDSSVAFTLTRRTGLIKLETWHSAEDKARFKLVRTDSYAEVPGLIVTADEATGECAMFVGGETKTMQFGPGGIRIVRRDR